MQCKTVGCRNDADGYVTYPMTFLGETSTTSEEVCADCGGGYERRAVLRASFVPFRRIAACAHDEVVGEA